MAAARLGENLEKDQQSEKLEIIEQPDGSARAGQAQPAESCWQWLSRLALDGGRGPGVRWSRFSDKGIRRSSDLFGIVDSQLIVSIPYITTAAELRAEATADDLLLLGSFVAVVIGLLIAAYFFLPPLDLMIAKARVGLFR